jgi:hypothetical protein
MKPDTKRKISRIFFNTDVFSPRGFYRRALLILLIFLLLDVAGLRKYAMLLSATSPVGDPEDIMTHVWAVLYLLFYFGAVILTPILLIASAILRTLLYIIDASARNAAPECNRTDPP